MKKLLYALAAILALAAAIFLIDNYPVYLQGLPKTDEGTYKNIPQKVFDANPSSVKLAPTKDLSQYVPSIRNQKQTGMCTAFATTYYMRTMLDAIQLGITDKKKLDSISYSPSFTYNSIKEESDHDNKVGVDIEPALQFLLDSGAIRNSEQKIRQTENRRGVAFKQDSKIAGYERLFSLLKNEDKVFYTKKALSENTPVIVGLEITETLSKLGWMRIIWHHVLTFFGKEDKDFAVWKPGDVNLLGGHAICIVGYDDNKLGAGSGAFKAVNSYGNWWGDQGFFWISYEDYTDKGTYAYIAYLAAKDQKNILLSGEVSMFADLTREEEKFFYNTDPKPTEKLVAYRLKDAQYTGKEYYFNVKVAKETYIYFVEENADENISKIIFPKADTLMSERIGAGTNFYLPLDVRIADKNVNRSYKITVLETGRKYYGREYFLFLFSSKKLSNIEDLLNQQTGSFAEKIQQAFGDDLVSANQIKYDSLSRNMKFEVTGEHTGFIVPMLIEYEHRPTKKTSFVQNESLNQFF